MKGTSKLVNVGWASPTKESELPWSGSQQAVYFSLPQHSVCWADRRAHATVGAPTVVPCDSWATTPIGLCRQHYLEIVGREG